MQQRLHIYIAVPQPGQVKVDAQIRPGDPEGRGGEGRRVDPSALVMQALPVDLIVVRPRPEADVAELPQADAAVHKVLVGVQNQVQQVLMGRHGQEAVHLHGGDVREEVVQLVMGILGGVEQVAVQLDVKRAVFFCVGHLVRRGQFVRRRVGGQAVCQQRLVAGEKLALRDEQVVVRADAVVPQGVEPAAKLPLHHDRVQPGIPEVAVEVGELRRAHGLVQHLSDDLLLDGREQWSVLPCSGRLADGLEEDGQQLLLVCQRKHGRPVHGLRGQFPAGDGSLGDMQKLCFGGSQGHGRGPFLVFFHGVGQQQRGRADERPQRVADHVIRLRHAQGKAVLRVLDPRAEDAAGQRREGKPPPAVPPSRQGVGQCQPQWEEEEDVHQHLSVKLRLLPRGREGGEGGEDGGVDPRRAGEEGGVEDDRCRHAEQDYIDGDSDFCAEAVAEHCPSSERQQHQEAHRPRIHRIDLAKYHIYRVRRRMTRARRLLFQRSFAASFFVGSQQAVTSSANGFCPYPAQNSLYRAGF